MRIPQSTLDQISERVSLTDVAQKYVALERKGDRYWGLCPFHNEKTPSFTVSPRENVFYCFGCQKGGTLFSFIMDIENLSFVEAVEVLAKEAGVELPRGRSDRGDDERSAMRELYGRVSGSFSYLLLNSKQASEARRYLLDRGVTTESVEKFNIGFAPGDRRWLYNFLLRKNYSQEFLDKSGMFSKRYKGLSLFSNRIIFPIRNRNGDTIAFGGRALGDTEPKYLNSPDTPIFNKRGTLYGLFESFAQIRKNRTFVVTEGYLDVIALHQADIGHSVAPLGTAFTENQAHILKRYADNGTLLFDGDDAGKTAAEKSVATCEKTGIQSEVVILPSDGDPGDYMRSGNYPELQKLLKLKQKGFTFILKRAVEHFDITDAGGKESALRYLIPYLDLISSEVRKESLLHEVADALGVDPSAVRNDYARTELKSKFDRRETHATKPQKKGIDVSHDLYLLLACAVNRDYFSIVRSAINAEDLTDGHAKELYIALEECFREEATSMDALLNHVEDEDLRRLITEKASGNEFSAHGKRLVSESVNRIKERSLKERREQLIRRNRELDRNGKSLSEIKIIQEEIMWIGEELEKLRNIKYE